MGIYKMGQHTLASRLCETASPQNMLTKVLDDGSVWGCIYALDVTSEQTFFTTSNYLDCQQPNRFSALKLLDKLYSSYVSMTNLAPRINGVNGFNAGAAITSEGYHKYGASALQLTGTTSGVEVFSQTSIAPVSLVAGHTYYVRVEIKQSTKQGSCDIFLGSTTVGGNVTAEGATVRSIPVSANNTWTIASAVHTLNASIATGKHKLRLDYNNSKTAGTMTFDGLMVIDLTEAFGPDFTPTKAWCDANIPFFTGTTIIDAQSSDFKRWEFMLTYPKLSLTDYNRWSQTGSPNSTAPGGYTRINTSWTVHAGPLRKGSGSAQYNCDNEGTTTWFAAIGQTAIWKTTDPIPSANSGSVGQTATELWIRIDNLAPTKLAHIYNSGDIVGEQLYEL